MRMKSRIAVMSYGRFTNVLRSTISKEDLEKLIIVESSFEETKDIAKRLWNSGEADVFVSGSSNLQMVKEVISAPIVPIQISGFDIMNNLLKASISGGKIAIISYKKPISNISIYKSILNIDVEEICYNNISELKILLKELRGKGAGAVIGSSLVCDLCDELGMNSIFIYSSNSIKNAISQAIQIQQSIQFEKYKSKQFNTILNYTYSGIIATDKNNIIQIYNPMAERIMGIPKEKVIGQNADHVIENTRLSRVLASGRQEIDQLQNVNSRIILTSRIPIIVEGHKEGVVATFQDVKSIQKAEHKIRRELHSKGLISKYSFNDIKGNSKAIKNCIEIAKEYADSDFNVLITGESGTGKELFAHSIHNRSKRKNEAFVAINCAAIPESLLESELFGYERGTFTGARKEGKIGLFELAHNGTILLDEIAKIPLSIQARLLRVIQEKEVMRLGSDRIIKIDAR
ncbi:MAG TPA: PAS domain S-box protein, partial [Candidatus Atribacteria bacterium]|nr:PAS domain S-box protein [Candidatus Atribacteria bacterium]